MIRLLALFALFAGSVAAGAAQPSSNAATLLVTSDGNIVIDGLASPVRSSAPYSVTGTYAVGDTVRVAVLSDLTAWDPLRADTLLVMREGRTELDLRLPIRTRVETLPLGARLRLVTPSGASRALGTGPVTIDLRPGETAEVVAEMDDHLSARAMLPQAENVKLILPPVGQPDADPVALLPMRGSTRTRTLIDLGIGALAGGAGALAIYYKFQADDLDDAYRDETSPRRGDEALRKDVVRYDTYSNVALAGMQVGLGVLAVRFILR